MAVITCTDVGVRYIRGDVKSIGIKEYVSRRITRTYHVEEFWADRHVTFTLNKGDMLGLVGSNGAGKSTLLKAITGILEPVEGSISVNGKIAALLELSSGFDPMMTVRENTYLRGAMLGYSKAFLDSRYDEIIAFAELEEFQDYTFRQLSSGMRSRLAFSIACLVNPDVLILDEVLSVGDGAFRRKSGAKMMEVLDSGVTGILVSHSISQVRELCNKVLWIDHGQQIAFTDDVTLCCDAYEEFLVTKNLPHSGEEMAALAAGHEQRLRKEQRLKQKKEAKRLQRILEKGESDAAVEAALGILRKSCPEALKEEYLNAP